MITKKEAKKISEASRRVSAVISGDAQHSRIASALSAEGYNGGYRDALNDVLTFLISAPTHWLPTRNGWWNDVKEEK